MFVTQIMRFHTIKLVVESEPIPDAIGYDPSSNSVPTNNPISINVLI
jgi:hypothetical protein